MVDGGWHSGRGLATNEAYRHLTTDRSRSQGRLTCDAVGPFKTHME